MNDKQFKAWLDEAVMGEARYWKVAFAVTLCKALLPPSHFPDRRQALKRIGDCLGHLVRWNKLTWTKLSGSKERAYTLPTTTLGDGAGADIALVIDSYCGAPEPYQRLTKNEAEQLFDKPPHWHIRHVIVRPKGELPYVLQVYPANSELKATEIVKGIRERVARCQKKYQWSSFLERGAVGILALVAQDKVDDVTRAVSRVPKNGGPRLIDKCRIVVRRQVNVDTAGSAIREIKSEGAF